jgi:hypothetical protein
MLGLLAIDVAAAAALVSLWYLWFARANRRRAAEVLQWMRNAFTGHAQILNVRWTGASRFHVRMRVGSQLFRHSSVMVQLTPREFPFSWLASRWKKHQETLTFEADLDCAPLFNLEVHNHRWCGRTRREVSRRQQFAIEQCAPFMLTTRHDWQREITNMMTALVASRECNVLSVTFRRTSPHFTAMVPLTSLSPQSDCEMEIFEVLRELAECAGATSF